MRYSLVRLLLSGPGFFSIIYKENGIGRRQFYRRIHQPACMSVDPEFLFRVGENKVIFREGAANPVDVADSSVDVESSSGTFVCQSDPEQYSEPAARDRLGQLLRHQPFQSETNNTSRAERIARLTDVSNKEDERKEARQRNCGRHTSVPTVAHLVTFHLLELVLYQTTPRLISTILWRGAMSSQQSV